MKEINIEKLLSDYAYSLTSNKERYEYQCKQLEQYSIQPKEFTGLSTSSRGSMFLGLQYTTSLIMMAKQLNLPYILILEDSAYPCLDLKTKLEKYLFNIPDDCGILKFAYFNYETDRTKAFENYIKLYGDSLGSCAYLIFQDCYNDFLFSLQNRKRVDVSIAWYNFFKSEKCVYLSKEQLFVQKNINRYSLHSPNDTFGYAYWKDNKQYTGDELTLEHFNYETKNWN